MLLAIDAGNTNVVFAVFDGERRLGSWRISTDHNRTSDEYAVWLTHLMALVQLRPLDIPDAILASVVPAATFHPLRLVRDHFRCAPQVVGAPGVGYGRGSGRKEGWRDVEMSWVGVHIKKKKPKT